MESNPILNLHGENVALGPVHKSLLPTVTRWMNDFEITRSLDAGVRPFTLENEESWYARVCAADNEAVFVIYEKPGLTPVGLCGLHQINLRNRTAILGIFIGEKSRWGRGYATEACRLLLGYGFGALSLHNVMLSVYAHNERAIRAYRRVGFKEIGRRRGAYLLDGQRHDAVLMDCLAGETL